MTIDKLTTSKCQCGHPGCNKHRLDQSGAEGMFDEDDAKKIAHCFNIHEELLAMLEELAPLAWANMSGGHGEVIDRAFSIIHKAGGKDKRDEQ